MFIRSSAVPEEVMEAPAPAAEPGDEKLAMMRDAMLAICAGRWDDAAVALARHPEFAAQDAGCLNLTGVVCQARRQWRRARRFYGQAMRADRSYAPAEQNMRRCYELDTFGQTNLPIALADPATIQRIGQLPRRPADDGASCERISLWIRPDATMEGVKRDWDCAGYAWAVGAVALVTVIGWPLVHLRFHLADTNVLMLYLLSVLWVATHHSRSAAVLASVLGVALFDFCFVPPYYTFTVADQQYVVTFIAMLLTALVISTLTHRIRQQTDLARQAWERVETEFLRNTLLSGVSHELRTPLAFIRGSAGSLLETGAALDRETRLDLLRMICSESERMERLINNLLDMTRLESGGLVIKKEWLPPQEVIGSALQHLGRRLDGHEVKIDCPAGLPMVQMDGVLIEQALANLIDNVIEYTPADSPIELTAKVEGGELRIEVADRGPGIPPGTEARVFEKFYRIHRDQSRRGIGLGLAIVRGVVEAHGGTVRAANRAGGGAVFSFTLPMTATPPAVDSTA